MSNPQNMHLAPPQSAEGLLESILEHERTFRGVSWPEEIYDPTGQVKPGVLEARMDELNAALRTAGLVPPAPAAATDAPVRLRGALGATPVDQAVDTLLRFDEETYKTFYDAKDEDIKVLILKLVKRLQNLETDLKSENFDTSQAVKLVGMGGVISAACFLVKGGAAVYGVMMLPAAMGAITTGAAIAAFAAVAAVVALLIAALLTMVLIMLKNASEIHLILNNTDYTLRLYAIHCNHGKEVARPHDRHDRCHIPPRAMVKVEQYDGTHREERVVYGGFFGFSKKEAASYGASGVIQLDMYNAAGEKHQTSTFLAYQVPLTNIPFFGGKNGCYVRCSAGNPSAKDFYKDHEKDIDAGHWEWTDQSGNIRLRKRIHSRSGSECFAITTYEQR